MVVFNLQIYRLRARLGRKPTASTLRFGVFWTRQHFLDFFLDHGHGVFDWVVQQPAVEGPDAEGNSGSI